MESARRTPPAPLSVRSTPSFHHTPGIPPGTTTPSGVESPPAVFTNIQPHLIR
jgi:hypothetical protein